MAESPREVRRKHEHALRRHEADMAKAERAFERELRRPDVAESLGLPSDLPERAIEILSHAMALDARGAQRPTLAETVDGPRRVRLS